jgi:hypothetical protein
VGEEKGKRKSCVQNYDKRELIIKMNKEHYRSLVSINSKMPCLSNRYNLKA